MPPIAPTARDAADIVVTLPAGEERDRALLAGIVRSTRDGVATRAGLTSVAPIAVTVHQTVEAFGRATGQPWWVPASTVETAIDLLPLGELRRRGVLESTLRAAVARAVLDSHLQNRPAWVRAGAAAYFTALPPAAPTAGARVRCPSDAELLRPISGGAEREALSRADRCFQRQIAQGRSWQDVR